MPRAGLAGTEQEEVAGLGQKVLSQRLWQRVTGESTPQVAGTRVSAGGRVERADLGCTVKTRQ